MQNAAVVPVILSGGAGTRLWPMSRPDRPKQLLPLTDALTMLQLTAQRVAGRTGFAAPIVVANAAHADAVERQLAAIGEQPQALILEPVARNTAPAIALAALAAGGGDAPLLVMPSDHVIGDVAAFHAAVEAALPAVRDGALATFGIAAHAPETGYGYIQLGPALSPGVHRVTRFVEKPARAAAEAMLASGDHAWNGGIFLFRADAYLAELQRQAPAIHAAACAAMAGATHDGARLSPDAAALAASPANSIDYAVMEGAANVVVVPVAMGWSDVGSWDALDAISPHDAAGNALAGDVVAIETSDCFVRSDGARVALLGVSNLIVVASGNDILIMPRGRSQDVKHVVAALDG